MKTSILAALFVGPMLTGCAEPTQGPQTFAPAYPERNAKGDPILTVYDGRTPCAVAGCNALKMELVLYHRSDT